MLRFMGLVVLSVTLLSQAGAQSLQGFSHWKKDFLQRLENAHFPSRLVADFNKQVSYYPEAINNDRSQAEFSKFLWEYLDSAVSTSRVVNGQQYYQQYAQLLAQVAKHTGVPAQIIVAIWGMETSYGHYTGEVPVFNSMATLAYEGRRRGFFEAELIAALKLVNRGDLPSLQIKGSWAGGLGLTQFIPSTYARYAVDYDGDGKRNLWQVGDALASAGNYLAQMGWVPGYRWGREVQLPRGFDYFLANDTNRRKSLQEWAAMGVRDAQGKALPADWISARLFVPAGQFGPKFLLYENFDVIKRYNNSDAYALGVALLSERVAGRPGLVATWPKHAKRLSKTAIETLQRQLNRQGFDAGVVDGILGGKTRRALQAYQALNDLVADGFLTPALFEQITQ